MVDRDTYRCACGESPRTAWQGSQWAQKPDGEYVAASGFWIATCDNKACDLYGVTLELTNHARRVAAMKGNRS